VLAAGGPVVGLILGRVNLLARLVVLLTHQPSVIPLSIVV
jgi:hypothetical protein